MTGGTGTTGRAGGIGTGTGPTGAAGEGAAGIAALDQLSQALERLRAAPTSSLSDEQVVDAIVRLADVKVAVEQVHHRLLRRLDAIVAADLGSRRPYVRPGAPSDHRAS